MAKSKLVKVNEKIAENVVGGYKKIEEGVVGGYKKIENGVVDGFNRISDKFVDQFLTREGESVEDAKKRLAAEQAARAASSKETAAQPVYHNGGNDIGKASVEASKKIARESVEASKKAGRPQ